MCELNFASYSTKYQTSQVAQVIKNPPANAREVGSISGWRRYPGCPRKWQPTLIFLPAKSHGQRSLAGYSPWGCKRVRYHYATKQQRFTIDNKNNTNELYVYKTKLPLEISNQLMEEKLLNECY